MIAPGRAVPLLAAAVAFVLAAGAASAAWTAGSAAGGSGRSAAAYLNAATAPNAMSAGDAITLSWAVTTLSTGVPASAYLIRRFDANTLAVQPILPGCSGRVAVTTCTDIGVPTGQWVYSVTPVAGTNWVGTESPMSGAVWTDPGDPVNAITATAVTGAAFQTGNTVYYRGVADGSLTLINAVSDADSGPAASTTSVLGGSAGGWTHEGSTVRTPAGGPYVANPFSWATGTTGTVTEVVTGRDAANNTASTTITLVNDSTPPTAGSISYADGYQPTSEVAVNFVSGTDAGAGVAERRLQRSSADFVGGACGSFGSFGDIGPNNPVSPFLDGQITDASCYQYRYVVTDRLTNRDVATSADVAIVDSSAGGPTLRSAGNFSVLAGAAGVTNTSATTMSGDLGVSPTTAVVGFPPGVVAGTSYVGDAVAAQAQADLTQAYSEAASRSPTGTVDGDLGGRTITPGTYYAGAALAVTGTLTLDGQNNPNALFVFQVNAALNTAAASHVNLVNGARASHVFWQVLGAAGTGANSFFAGTILAAGAITLGADSELIGRALSFAAVTLANNTIRFTGGLPPVVTLAGGASDVTKDTTPTIAGTSDAAVGTTVTVTVAEQLLTTTVQADGRWTVTTDALAAGSHVIVASVHDSAGNAGTATQQLFVEVNPDPVLLGPVASFSVLGAAGVTSTGATTVAGDLGVNLTGTVVGFPPGIVAGTVHDNDATAAAAHAGLAQVSADVASRRSVVDLPGDPGGRTLHAGVYHFATAITLTGSLTLDGQNDPSANFIFQVDAAVGTAASSAITLVNGAQSAHVFWRVNGAANTGASSLFVGTIMATGAITLGAGGVLIGRALTSAAITMAANSVRFA